MAFGDTQRHEHYKKFPPLIYGNFYYTTAATDIRLHDHGNQPVIELTALLSPSCLSAYQQAAATDIRLYDHGNQPVMELSALFLCSALSPHQSRFHSPPFPPFSQLPLHGGILYTGCLFLDSIPTELGPSRVGDT